MNSILAGGSAAAQLLTPIQDDIDLRALRSFIALRVDEDAPSVRTYIKALQPTRKASDHVGGNNYLGRRGLENRPSCYVNTHNVPALAIEQLLAVSLPD